MTSSFSTVCHSTMNTVSLRQDVLKSDASPSHGRADGIRLEISAASQLADTTTNNDPDEITWIIE